MANVEATEGDTAASLHPDLIIVDGVSPLLEQREHVDLYLKGGVTCVAPTVAAQDTASDAFRSMAVWLDLIAARDDLCLVRTAADIEAAKAAGGLGILFHFQGTAPFEQRLDYVDAFANLGLRMAMLAYNRRGAAGDGCEEPGDAGLSRYGRRLIGRLERCGVLLDLSHTGRRTTLEAIDAATRPVVFSHSNARALLATARNIDDDQARAAAETGGLIGLTLVPYLIVRDRRPTIDDFIDHIAHFADLVGIEHVGLGLDYYWGQQPFASDALADRIWQRAVDAGDWDPVNYPRPPHHYPDGMSTPAEMQGLTAALLRRGFHADEVASILGLNWLRVFRATLGA